MSKKSRIHREQMLIEKGETRRSAPAQNLLFPVFEKQINNSRFGILFACTYGIIMLFVGLTYHTVGDYNVETDFFWSYVPEAKQALLGIISIDGFRGPGYPILLAMIHVVIKNYFNAGVVLSVAAGAASLGLVFYIIKKIVNADKALFVCLMLAVNSIFIQYTYTAGTDMVFTAVMITAVFFFFRSENIKYVNIILCAFFTGAAYLVRYNGIVAIFIFVIGILFMNVFNTSWKDRIKISLLITGIFILVILPYGLYCYGQKGSFFYTENYLNIAREMYKDKLSHDQFWMSEAAKFKSTFQVIMSDPGLFFNTILRNIYGHFIGDLSNAVNWQTGIFIIPGLLLLWKERTNRRLMVYFLLAAGFFTILLLLLQQPRYSLFLLPPYLILASLTLTWNGFLKIRMGKKHHIGSLMAVIIIIWTFTLSYKSNKENIASGPKEIPVIAEWFRKAYGDTESGKTIVTRKPHIAYYLDMKMAAFPYVQNENELRRQVQASEASYLFFSTVEAYMRPQFQSLLDPRNAPKWLVPVIYTSSPPAVLYKINFGGKQ